MKQGRCTTCKFYTDLNCTAGTYFAETDMRNELCFGGELWMPNEEWQGKAQKQRNDSSLYGCLAWGIIIICSIGIVFYEAISFLIQLF